MRPPQALPRPMPWSCAHPSATMCTAAACSTFLSACRHRSLVATCRRDLASSSRRRIGEAEAWFQLRGWRQTFRGQDTGHQQVWSHREAGLPPIFTRCMLCASVPMSSHIPLQCARAGLLLGASVGALSSRCARAALALRLRYARTMLALRSSGSGGPLMPPEALNASPHASDASGWGYYMV